LKKIVFCCFVVFTTLIPIVYGQEPNKTPAQKIDTVFIKSAHVTSTIQKLPAAVTVYQAKVSDATRQQLSLQEYTQQIPGLFAQNTTNFAQDLRISIRGFGSRAAFGIRGIKLIVDGIPETTPDGQGQLDNLNLGIIDRIEVLKGPSSSLYGNASGGVISIQTINQIEQPFSNWKAAIGSYGFQNYQATAGIKSGTSSFIFHGNYVTSDGYRDQSGFQQYNFNVNASFKISDKFNLKALVNYSDSPQADDPGGLNLDAVEENRRQARDRNILFKTGETIQQFKSGLSAVWNLNSNTTGEGYLFYNNRQFEGRLPFEFGGLVDLGRDYVGQGVNITYSKGKNTLKAGYDFAYQNDDRQRFRNLEGEKGQQTLDQKERFTNLGVFVTNHLEVDKWYFTGGIRFDYNKLAAVDEFLIDGDDSGEINLNSFNPSAGVSYAFAKANNLYINVATSFETPALSELSANPNGDRGFNEDLEAQKATNYELGIKGQLTKDLRYQMAFFYINTQDDLVPFELAAFPDRTFFRNAGRTERKGIEIEGAYNLSKEWTFTAAYTYSDFSYNDFTTASGTFNGNYLPGIAQHFTNLGIQFKSEKGFYVNAQASLVGKQFANDSNETEVDGYENINLRTGFNFVYKKIRILPYLGINNILDQEYTDNVRINAFGSRFFEPAPGINGYGGFQIKF